MSIVRKKNWTNQFEERPVGAGVVGELVDGEADGVAVIVIFYGELGKIGTYVLETPTETRKGCSLRESLSTVKLTENWLKGLLTG